MPFRRTNAAAWAPPRSVAPLSSCALCSVAAALIALACARSMSFDLAFGQGYSFVLAGQRLFGVGRQWFAGARHQTVEALHEIAPVWIDAADSHGHQDPADAVGVGRFLLHQHGPLAVLAFGVLFCRGRHLNYPADARFAALQRQQHANQKLEIDAVGLTPSRTPFHRNACGID